MRFNPQVEDDGRIVTRSTPCFGCTQATPPAIPQELDGDKAFGTALTLAFAKREQRSGNTSQCHARQAQEQARAHLASAGQL